jgi:hypothetical protein
LLDNFDDRYLGPKASDPALDNDGNALITGALYFNTTDGVMKVYTASGWLAASSASVATLATFEFVATAAQTVFTGNDANGASLSYVAPALLVTLNGVRLRPGDDYTATNGTSITLVSAAAAGDELVVDAFGAFLIASVNGADIQDATTNISKLNASGTRNGTTFLAGDNTFKTVAVTPTAVSDQTNSSTGYFDLPSGTTAQRPTGAAGMIRHNSSNGFIEYWDTNSSQWIGIGAVAATGGTVTTYTGFKAHTFTSSGTLTVQSAGLIDYVIVAGGGAGGCWHAGGGGAGGMLTGSVSVSAGTYSITIGAGGAGGTTSVGNNGGDTTAFGLTAIGGGRGGNYNTTQPGSGGSGSGGNGFSGFDTAGSGTAGQGNSGGNGNGSHFGGGGGGKGAAGETAVSGTRAGNGGVGGTTSIRTGSTEYYAGGGGGGVWNNNNYGTGGTGGGGNGSYNGNTNAPTPGAANTGGGGGGSGSQGNVTSYAAQTTGGSGIVIIRYIV